MVFELWLFVLRHVATPQNRLYPPTSPPTEKHSTMSLLYVSFVKNTDYALVSLLFPQMPTSKMGFTHTYNFTFKVRIVEGNLPHRGRVNILVPIYLTYRDSKWQEFTAVKALNTHIDVPEIPKAVDKTAGTATGMNFEV